MIVFDFGGEPRDGERRHRAGRLAEVDQRPQVAQAVQRPRKGVGADGVVHDLHSLAAVIWATRSTKFSLRYRMTWSAPHSRAICGLLLGPHRGDDRRPEMLGPPDERLTHSAGRGMNQQRLARVYAMNLAKQHARGEALDGEASGGFVRDAVRQAQRQGNRQQAPLRIRPVRGIDVGDPIAGCESRTPAPTFSTTAAASSPGIPGSFSVS